MVFYLIRACNARIRRTASSLIGQLMAIRWPEPLLRLFLKGFVKWYNIQMQEAEKTIYEYKSLADLFVRRLKPEARPLGDSTAVHPCDAEILQSGRLQNGTMIQAKGILYSVEQLLGSYEREQEQKQEQKHDRRYEPKYEDGGHFDCYYLCPTDYHRVHSPVTGEVFSVRHFSGDLLPVHKTSVCLIPQLYIQNERVVIFIKTQFGVVSVVLVGALNVGNIHCTFDDRIQTNVPTYGWKLWDYQPSVQVEKGQELGFFALGSTVIVVWPKTWPWFEEKSPSKATKPDFFTRSNHSNPVRRVRVRENILLVNRDQE